MLKELIINYFCESLPISIELRAIPLSEITYLQYMEDSARCVTAASFSIFGILLVYLYILTLSVILIREIIKFSKGRVKAFMIKRASIKKDKLT